MPLIDAATPPSTEAAGVHYVVFFASGSPPWCPDCVDALAPLRAVFGDDAKDTAASSDATAATSVSTPTAYLVRVGERHEWKGVPDNPYRLAPYHVQGVPTIIKMQGVSCQLLIASNDA